MCSIRSKFPNKLPVSYFSILVIFKYNAFRHRFSLYYVWSQVVGFFYAGNCWALHPWKDSPPVGQNKVPGSLRANLGSVPVPAQVNDLLHCVIVESHFSRLLPTSQPSLAFFFCMQDRLLPTVSPNLTDFPLSCPPSKSLSSSLGIRLRWTPPRLCSSSWLRKACPACHPAWGRFIPSTGTLTASSTSPTPPKRCSEHLSQRPGRPAEPEADKMNWTLYKWWWPHTTELGRQRQTEPCPDCVCPGCMSS